MLLTRGRGVKGFCGRKRGAAARLGRPFATLQRRLRVIGANALAQPGNPGWFEGAGRRALGERRSRSARATAGARRRSSAEPGVRRARRRTRARRMGARRMGAFGLRALTDRDRPGRASLRSARRRRGRHQAGIDAAQARHPSERPEIERPAGHLVGLRPPAFAAEIPVEDVVVAPPDGRARPSQDRGAGPRPPRIGAGTTPNGVKPPCRASARKSRSRASRSLAQRNPAIARLA